MGQYHYEKFNSSYEVSETHSHYKVACTFNGEISSSRVLNALENRFRMRSLDLIGIYQLYKEYEKQHDLDESYFQLFVAYNSYNFKATVEQLEGSDFVTKDQMRMVTFSVPKKDFVVDVSAYDLSNIHIRDLLYKDYSKKRNPLRAYPLYNHKDFSSADYISMYKDFLRGIGKISPEYDLLIKEKRDSRFELSVLQEPDSLHQAFFEAIADEAVKQKDIIAQIIYTELVTSVTPEDKQAYYEAFVDALNPEKTLWEDMVAFVAKKKAVDMDHIENPTMFNTIECFPGAINPFALRLSNERAIYDKAEEKFAKEKIKATIEYLDQSINYEGIHTRTLNLIGAAYRFDGKPEKAMPYLILAYLMDSDAQFVAGNIALCLNALGYKNNAEFIGFLNDNGAIDPWSKAQFETLIK